ncbi:MAG: cytochrome c [Proteobacteria bacterium]|jgi:cytochrome c553|nr:cytochrome c [Pseudomonadota bacterium]MBT5065365.1 cytochrome c [Pseudomonadota bacterium]MBT6193927.1 cytochrome c [Pseudomonadota bacterium]MBT6465897.1 cytochrome c [Pseudomonadota bacterium]MBT6674750.1 cytochrome c [Pseudomonadota bacterium]
MVFRIFFASLLLMFLSFGSLADGDVAQGEIKAETCLGCHAVTGYNNVYPTYHVPKLGGQSAGYIASALLAYKNGTRVHGTMHANAADLTDTDIEDIAAFMSSYKK